MSVISNFGCSSGCCRTSHCSLAQQGGELDEGSGEKERIRDEEERKEKAKRKRQKGVR